jgi:DNA-binding IclR family transcriptional regulator
MAQKGDSLSTIQRGLQVVDILLELEGAGPTEVAERIDLPVTTVYEYLRSMSETKFVNRRDGEYYLSSYFLTICGKMRHRSGLFQVAKREMKRVADKTGELVGLTIEDNGFAILFHQEAGEYALQLGTYLGAATPLHTLANGKAILAHLPEDRLDEILGEGPLEVRTEHTITDPERLRSELSKVRSKGYAADWDEQVVGMGMISVPIIVDDRALAAVGISTPTHRLHKDEYREELLQELKEMQNTISINYQYSA